MSLENGNFRVYSVPVLYLPYATIPAEQRRESGFLIPELGNTSQKGFVLGDSVYWAPLDWMDMTLGAADYTKRGWSQSDWQLFSDHAQYMQGVLRPQICRFNDSG